MPNDVFAEATPPVANPALPADPPQVQPQVQTVAPGSALDTLVGEGKKYKTAEELAVAYANADGHIGTLTTELQEIRKDLDGRLNAAEILKELKEIQMKPNESQSAQTAPVLDEGKIAELVKSTVSEMDVEGKKAQNRMEVSERLAREWGGLEPSKVMLTQKAAELGVTVGFLSGVVESSPNAFYQLVGLTGAPAARATPGPGDVANQRVGTNDNGGPGGHVDASENDWSFWQKMRREDFHRYNSAAMHNRRFELIQAGTLVTPKR